MSENLNMFTDEAPVPEKKAETEEIQGEKIAIPAMRADGKSLMEKAKAFVVSSIETMHEAETISKECYRREKIIEERFAKVREKTKAAKLAADKANSEVIALIGDLQKPYKDARAILDPKAREWQREENKRLADEAEKKRQEEQRKLDEDKAKKVSDLVSEGKIAEAGELESTPDPVATVEVEKVESSKGTSNRAHWKALCHDLAALVKAIAEGKAPISLVMFNQTEGDAQARACQDTKSYPGVAFKDVGITVHR